MLSLKTASLWPLPARLACAILAGTLVAALLLVDLDDFKAVNKELKLFNEELADRPQVVALNKTDIAEAKEKSLRLLKFFSSKCIKVFPVSSVTGEGLKELVDFVGEQVEKMKQEKQ